MRRRLYIAIHICVFVALSFDFANAGIQSQAPDSITGRILGDDGHPIVNASIVAYPVRRELRLPPGQALSDDDGNFRITRLAAGD
ncbi:MAG TPA: carboxypeptidase-like regulatory domain-containing protein, partial [Blastocatellia bacterium]|nr:carboxypeptidase-like regulatory domain-containing protein [Blastocatellia bacterium]